MELPDNYTGMPIIKMETEGEGIYASTAQFDVRRKETDQGLTLPPKTNSGLSWQPVTDEELEAVIGSIEAEQQPSYASHDDEWIQAAFEDAFAPSPSPSPSPSPRQMTRSRSRSPQHWPSSTSLGDQALFLERASVEAPARPSRSSSLSAYRGDAALSVERVSNEAFVPSGEKAPTEVLVHPETSPVRSCEFVPALDTHHSPVPLSYQAQVTFNSSQFQQFSVSDSLCSAQQTPILGETRIPPLSQNVGDGFDPSDFDASGFDYTSREETVSPGTGQSGHRTSQTPRLDDTKLRSSSIPQAGSMQAQTCNNASFSSSSTRRVTPANPDIPIPSIEPPIPVNIPFGSSAPLPRDDYTREEMTSWPAWLLKREADSGSQKTLASEVLQSKLKIYRDAKKRESQDATRNSLFHTTFPQKHNSILQTTRIPQLRQQQDLLPSERDQLHSKSPSPTVNMQDTLRTLPPVLAGGIKFLLSSLPKAGTPIAPTQEPLKQALNNVLSKIHVKPDIASCVSYGLLQFLCQAFKESVTNPQIITTAQMAEALQEFALLLENGEFQHAKTSATPDTDSSASSTAIGELESIEFYEAKLAELISSIESLKAENPNPKLADLFEEDEYENLTDGVSQLGNAVITALRLLKKKPSQNEDELESLRQRSALQVGRIRALEDIIIGLKAEKEQVRPGRIQKQQLMQPAHFPSTPPPSNESSESEREYTFASPVRGASADGTLGWVCGLTLSPGQECLAWNTWYSRKDGSPRTVRSHCSKCRKSVPEELRLKVKGNDVVVNAEQQVGHNSPAASSSQANYLPRATSVSASGPLANSGNRTLPATSSSSNLMFPQVAATSRPNSVANPTRYASGAASDLYATSAHMENYRSRGVATTGPSTSSNSSNLPPRAASAFASDSLVGHANPGRYPPGPAVTSVQNAFTNSVHQVDYIAARGAYPYTQGKPAPVASYPPRGNSTAGVLTLPNPGSMPRGNATASELTFPKPGALPRGNTTAGGLTFPTPGLTPPTASAYRPAASKPQATASSPAQKATTASKSTGQKRPAPEDDSDTTAPAPKKGRGKNKETKKNETKKKEPKKKDIEEPPVELPLKPFNPTPGCQTAVRQALGTVGHREWMGVPGPIPAPLPVFARKKSVDAGVIDLTSDEDEAENEAGKVTEKVAEAEEVVGANDAGSEVDDLEAELTAQLDAELAELEAE